MTIEVVGPLMEATGRLDHARIAATHEATTIRGLIGATPAAMRAAPFPLIHDRIAEAIRTAVDAARLTMAIAGVPTELALTVAEPLEATTEEEIAAASATERATLTITQ